MLYNDLIKLKNAYLAKHREVIVPYSNVTYQVLEVLKRRRYIGEITVDKKDTKKYVSIELLYTQKISHLNDVKLLSKPGRRLYMRVAKLHPVRQGFGDVIVSTSQGVMTAGEARKKGIGGELICEVF